MSNIFIYPPDCCHFVHFFGFFPEWPPTMSGSPVHQGGRRRGRGHMICNCKTCKTLFDLFGSLGRLVGPHWLHIVIIIYGPSPSYFGLKLAFPDLSAFSHVLGQIWSVTWPVTHGRGYLQHLWTWGKRRVWVGLSTEGQSQNAQLVSQGCAQ